MAVKICQKCGDSNLEYALRCVVCGNSLKDVKVVGIHHSYKSTKKVSTQCKYCGETLQAGSQKCKYCGTPVVKLALTPSYTPKATSSAIFHLDAMGIVLLIISTIIFPPAGLIIGGISLFSDNEDKHDSGKMLMLLGIFVSIIEFGLVYYRLFF